MAVPEDFDVYVTLETAAWAGTCDKKSEGGSAMVVEVVTVEMGRVDVGFEVSTEQVSVVHERLSYFVN